MLQVTAATWGTPIGSAGAVTFDTWAWSTESQHALRHVHGDQHACPWSSPVNRSSSSRSDVISLFPALETGRMERGLVGSVRQGSCLLSFYFPIHTSSSVQPCDYQRDIRDKSRSWPCWSTLLVDICPARAVGGDAGSISCRAPGAHQVDGLCQIACEPANKSGWVGGVSRQLSSCKCCFYFWHQGSDAEALQRDGGESSLPLFTLISWRCQNSLSQSWLNCLLREETKSSLIREPPL